MPRYFFDVHDGIEAVDDTGTKLLNDEAALAQAVKIACTYPTRPGMLAADSGAVIVTVRDGKGAQVMEARLVFTATNG